MDPFTAAILLGTTMASMYQADQQKSAQQAAMKKAEKQAADNQNALVEQGFKKKKLAMGLGQTPMGGQVASQSGGVLTSVTNGNEASGL